MTSKPPNGLEPAKSRGGPGQDPFRSLFDQSTDAIFIVEKTTGRYLSANAAAITLTGYPLTVLQTLPPMDVLQMDEKRWLQAVRLSISREELGEVVYLRGDGSKRIARLSLVPYNEAAVLAIATDMTEQKRVKQGLLESERKIRSVFRAAPTGIGVVQNRILREVNVRFCDMCGYSRAELVGNSARMLYPTDEEFEYVGLVKYRQIANWGIGSVETRFRRKDGNIIHVLMRSSALDPHDLSLGVSITVLDISERKRDEEKLKASEQRFRELFDNMASGVAICDSPDAGGSFIFTDINQSCLTYLQSTVDSVVGREVRDVFPGIEALGLLDVLKRVWTSGIHERHPASLYKDDRIEAWVENYVCKLSSGELVVIFEDVTAERRSQEAQARLERQIQEAQKLESIGVLAGGIAHDFNNILFPISGISELLMEDLPQGSPEHESITEIYQAARRAGDLVKQILSFSRRAEHKKMPTRIQQVLKEIVKLVRSTIPSNVDIVYDIQNNCGPVMVDPTQLHQIAMNLITNAYHAMENTTGRITVNLREIIMDADDGCEVTLRPGIYAQFSIADTGCGIDPEIMDKIFEPYFTTKVQGKGTGLGLSVVYGIVQDHHGDIRVNSCPGKGTTMDLYFPVLDREVVDQVNEVGPVQGRGDERIMVVDDEAQVAQLEKRILERSGYRVTSFTSCPAALDAFRRSPEAFDLVVTDITMPDMTGDQLARKLISIRPEIRIIVCTGFSERIDPEEISTIGIRRMLMKPIRASEMIRTVRRVLDTERDVSV